MSDSAGSVLMSSVYSMEGLYLPAASLGCNVKAFDIDDGALGDSSDSAERMGIADLKMTVRDVCSPDDGDDRCEFCL